MGKYSIKSGAFILALALFSSHSPTFANDAQKNNEKKDPQLAPDSPSALRFWNGSFDRAADATREVEKHNKIVETQENCPTVPADGANFTAAELKQREACKEAQKAVKKMSEEAGGIRKEQRIFADVSRVSDVAAVGAVATTAGTQLFMKDDSQASNMKKVANIQEVAGYASYATGATDFGLGAYAYLNQKKRLEDLKKSLGSTITSNPAIQADLENSIEKTKKAAYSHMLFGAGKAAAGFVSMQMAKSNRKQAEDLKSLTDDNTANSYVAPNPGGVPFTYPSNQATFSVRDPATGNVVSTTSTGTDSAPTGFASSGASVMPGTRAVASNNKGDGISASAPGGGAGGGSGASSGSDSAAAEANAENEAKDNKNKEALSGFEVAIGGGGARYNGSSAKGSAEENPVLGVFGAGTDAPKSVATGINPNKLYQDATSAQGEGMGENGPNTSLFELVKAKHNKMLEGGRIQGFGEVQVKN